MGDSVSYTGNYKNTRITKIESMTLLLRLLLKSAGGVGGPAPRDGGAGRRPDTRSGGRSTGRKGEPPARPGYTTLPDRFRQPWTGEEVTRLPLQYDKHVRVTYKVTTCTSKQDTGCLQPP